MIMMSRTDDYDFMTYMKLMSNALNIPQTWLISGIHIILIPEVKGLSGLSFRKGLSKTERSSPC